MPTNTSACSIGDRVRLTFTVKAGTSTSSTANTDSDVTFILNTPSGGERVEATTSTGDSTSSTGVSKTADGVYYVQHTTTEAGRYTYHFRSTAAITATTGGAFAVRPKYASTA